MILDDDILHELLILEREVKPMLKRIEEIKDACKKKGSFCTYLHACTVWEQQRTGLPGLKIVIDALGVNLLKEHDLIKTSTFQLVKVAPVIRNIKES